MAKQEVKQKRTLVKFAVQSSEYEAGKGVTTGWRNIEARVGTDATGNAIMTDCFYCEWLGSYGATAIQQQADGVTRPARVRMPFVRCVYEALLQNNVRIYLQGKRDATHTFVLASAVDNYNNENKLLEFNVKQHIER